MHLFIFNQYTGTMSKLTVETVTLNICIPGVQAEAMSPLATHLSKTCEDRTIKEPHLSDSYILGLYRVKHPHSLRTAGLSS